MQRLVVVMSLVAVAIANPAAGQTGEHNWERCQDASDQQAAIDACTALIQSGGETPGRLAVAFNNRGYAYRRQGQNDRRDRGLH